eukprot:TCALIF_13501-PA protein Name:"Similar to CdsA Phosphatidate cytidylyltransferase, photoreceptor-specific (Drosophila melanogaster)" AED:0.19 eAED:0.19 QI:0/0.75/0.77/0.88/0.87/0.88/9/612/360
MQIKPDEMDSDGEDRIKLDTVGSAIGQDKNSFGNQLLERVLSGLPPRWRNWVIRGIFTWLMIGGFGFIIYGGPLALMLTTLVVQVKCFSEIINIGYAVYRVHNLPWFRSLSWYFLVASNYFLYGESLVDYFGVLVNRTEFLPFLVRYHRFISFSMYVSGFVWFVLSLVKRYYMRQFSLFAWTHVALLIVVTQSYLIIQNMFEGLIWFILPIMMVVMNDVMAYMFGFFFGKTPLIQLSPKKTWEGFVGGGISTVFLSWGFSYFMCQYNYFICPIGFFASGFKRAFKIKDFGDIIPGHGGIMDRFDCQFLMATFVNVYIHSFIRSASPQKLIQQVFMLKPEEQLTLFYNLQDSLTQRGILQP